jgi:hypothetical protein
MDNPHSSRAPDAREEMLAAVRRDGFALKADDSALIKATIPDQNA